MRKKLLMCSSARMGIHFIMIPPNFLKKVKPFSFLLSFLQGFIEPEKSSNYGYLPVKFRLNSFFLNSLFLEIIPEAKATTAFNNLLNKRC